MSGAWHIRHRRWGSVVVSMSGFLSGGWGAPGGGRERVGGSVLVVVAVGALAVVEAFAEAQEDLGLAVAEAEVDVEGDVAGGGVGVVSGDAVEAVGACRGEVADAVELADAAQVAGEHPQHVPDAAALLLEGCGVGLLLFGAPGGDVGPGGGVHEHGPSDAGARGVDGRQLNLSGGLGGVRVRRQPK